MIIRFSGFQSDNTEEARSHNRELLRAELTSYSPTFVGSKDPNPKFEAMAVHIAIKHDGRLSSVEVYGDQRNYFVRSNHDDAIIGIVTIR